MIGIHKIVCVICCYSLIVALPVVMGRSSDPEGYVELLQAASQQLISEISCVELISKRTLEYPLLERSTSRTAKLRIKGDKVRSDEIAEIFVFRENGGPEGIVQQSWTSSYNGEVTYKLPIDAPIFTIDPGNTVQEYGLFFQGAYMNGTRLDKWLENMEITYSGTAEGKLGRVHLFAGLRKLSSGKDGKQRLRRFEIAASENHGFVIVSWKVYDEHDQLLAHYDASKLVQIADGIWLPTRTQKESYLGPNGQLSRRERIEIEYKAVNESIDDSVFKLSAPRDYTIVDRVRDIVISPSELQIDTVELLEANGGQTVSKADYGQSRAIDDDSASAVIQPTGDHEQQTVQQIAQRASRKSSRPTASGSHLGTRRMWAYRGLILIALVLAIIAGIMIGKQRQRWHLKQ